MSIPKRFRPGPVTWRSPHTTAGCDPPISSSGWSPSDLRWSFCGYRSRAVDELPEAWATEAAPGALIVAPVSLSDLAKTHAVVRVRCGDSPDILTAETVIPGGFVEACDEVLEQWLVPPSGVDALIHDDNDRPWWISADWLRHGGGEPGRTLLNQLISQPHKAAGPMKATENGDDVYAFLLATRPDGLTTAALGDPAWRIGATTPTGAAFIAP